MHLTRLILKILIFLLHDERWDNLRSHLFLIFGEERTTYVFGVILALVCPIMFGIQNVLLGMCLFEDASKNLANAFCHVMQSMRYQLVVLYDLSLFRGHKKADTKRSWPGVLRIVVGYILYVLPVCGLVTLSIFGHTKFTLCRLPKATFLLDNDVLPVVNMSTLYRQRQLFAQEIIEINPGYANVYLRYQDGEGLLTWDYKATNDQRRDSYRRYKYWSMENITDLLTQYNYVGFHDVCIYPRVYQDTVTLRDTHRLQTKGLNLVAKGYAVDNSSGTDYNHLFTDKKLQIIIFN